MKILKYLLLFFFVCVLISMFTEEDKKTPLADSKLKMRIFLEKEAEKVLKYPDTYDYKSFTTVLTGDTLTGQLRYTAKNVFGVPTPRTARVWVRLTDNIIDPSKPSSKINHSRDR
jgi:hypothetical protein